MSAQPSAHLATGKESQPQLKTNSRKKLFSKERKSAAATAAAATLSQKALRVLNMQKPSKYYPAESVRLPRLSRKKPSLGKLRESIKPGTVLILLSGNYSGKRVVFLKRLEESGMLLVTGPFKVNGVPLRRVNQAFVLATSTKVNVDEVLKNEVAHVTDALFNSIKTSKPRSKPTEKLPLDPERIALQKNVDAALITAINATKDGSLCAYLKASFTLRNGQRPHLMKF